MVLELFDTFMQPAYLLSEGDVGFANVAQLVLVLAYVLLVIVPLGLQFPL